MATEDTNRWHTEQVALVCAQNALHTKFYPDLSREEFDRRIANKLAPVAAGQIQVTEPDLKELGCSTWSQTVSVVDIFRARSPDAFTWTQKLAYDLLIGLGLTFAASFAVYGVIRALGWVISGFF